MKIEKSASELQKEFESIAMDTFAKRNLHNSIEEFDVISSLNEVEYKALSKSHDELGHPYWTLYYGHVFDLQSEDFHIENLGTREMALEIYRSIRLGSGQNEGLEARLAKFISEKVTHFAEKELLDE